MQSTLMSAAPLAAPTANRCNMVASGSRVVMRPFAKSLATPLTLQRVHVARRVAAAPVTAAAAAPPQQQKIRIKLKSYWVDLLHNAVDKIMDAATTTGATIAGPVPLPTRYGQFNWRMAAAALTCSRALP